MIIDELAYLETLPQGSVLIGGASLAIAATALATGNTTYTLADTQTSLRMVPSGKVTIGRGSGYAIAMGDDAYTDVFYLADGFDRVIATGQSRQTKTGSRTQVRVVALDLPY
jgi:hypothetical protein